MPISWGPNNVYTCAQEWQTSNQIWLKNKNELKEDAVEICYESFIKDPESHLKQMCRFLDLPYEQSMLSGYKIFKNNSKKWQSLFFMSPRELEAFEYVAGDTLKLFGYKTAIENPSFPAWLRWLSIVDNRYKLLSNFILRR